MPRAMASLSAEAQKSQAAGTSRRSAAAPAACPRRRRGDAAARLDEVEFAGKTHPVAHAQPAVEIEQIHAAAQQHVLAVVDHLGILVGRRHRDRTSRGRPEIRALRRDRPSNPASPSAAAAASPASPPPTTMALGISRFPVPAGHSVNHGGDSAEHREGRQRRGQAASTRSTATGQKLISACGTTIAANANAGLCAHQGQ